MIVKVVINVIILSLYRYNRKNIWNEAATVWRLCKQSDRFNTVGGVERHSQSERCWPREVWQAQQPSVGLIWCSVVIFLYTWLYIAACFTGY